MSWVFNGLPTYLAQVDSNLFEAFYTLTSYQSSHTDFQLHMSKAVPAKPDKEV